MKIVLLVSSLASLALLGGIAYHENFLGEWRDVQRWYRDLLVRTADDDRARRSAAAFRIEHKQAYLVDLDRVDRCTTCHLGVENPAMAKAPLPLSTHPGDHLARHPVQRFGCTVCHQGQGRVVSRDEAHGWDRDGEPVPHVETPILRGPAVYTSCGRCHYETDLFGGVDDLYASTPGSPAPIDAITLTGSLPGAAEIAAGKRLMVESGCLGCHKYRGRGGTLGPDITYVGDKTRHDFDFSHVRGPHTVEQWLHEHFLYPAEVSPGTTMPSMGFTPREARQLTLAMLAQHRKSAPASHRPRPILASATRPSPVRGETLYAMFCSSCHGKQGHGTTMRSGLWPRDADPWGHDWDSREIVVEQRGEIEVLVPSLNHPDTLAVASDEYLRRVIAHGRPGTKMIGWEGEGGLTEDEITLLIDHLRSWNPAAPEPSEVSSSRGDVRVGRALYRANCASCHGVDGEGGIGVSLRSPTFLAISSDDFLRDTIVHGRPNTAMPAWREFSAQELSDILAFMREWQPGRAETGEVLAAVARPGARDAMVTIGRTLYRANCVMCHGASGEGDLGPSLNTPEFLSVVPDEFLARTLVEGRPGTAMPSWRHLSSEDVAALVHSIRAWQTAPSKTESWHAEPVARGDPTTGGLIYRQICSSCHGLDAEGATGPQLGNPVFLASATDRMLFEWIARGKSGTEMRGFQKGLQGIAELGQREIEDVVAYLRSLERVDASTPPRRVAKSPHGRPEKGAVHYATACAGCHGDHGEGASGPALSNPAFLRHASDGFLMATLALGRRGTEMRPVKRGPQSILELSSDEVNDIVAFLREWEYAPPFDPATGIPHRFVVPWDLARGRSLYESNCAGCHGVEGRGAWAPELRNEGFLAAATDGFLQATIVRGRTGTAMRAFGRGGHGISELPPDDVDDIVAYIRSWSESAPSPMTIPAERSIVTDTRRSSDE